MPLQLGVSALWSLAQTAMSGALGLTLGLVLVRYYSLDDSAQRHLPDWFGLLVIFGWSSFALVPFAAAHLWCGIRDRPTDVVLSAESLRLEGGRFGGRSLAWTELDPARCRVEVERGTRLALWQALLSGPAFFAFLIFEMLWPLWGPPYVVFLGLRAIWRRLRRRQASPKRPRRRPHLWEVRPFEVRTLHLVDHDGTDVVAGEARHAGEWASLEAVLDSVRAMAGRSQASVKHRAVPGLELLVCPSCAAPVAPAAAAHVRCHSCDAEVPVPDELRSRIAAAREVATDRPWVARELPRLLAQPGARAAMTRLAAVTIPMQLAWPIAIGIACHRFTRQLLGLSDTMLLALAASSLVLACYFIGRSILVDRLALRVVALDFSAHAPAAIGGPPTCRYCSAPLPEPMAPTDIVVQCAYCEADNVLGIDYRGDAAPLSGERRSLEDALARRRRTRWWWYTAAIAAAPLIGLSAWAVGRATAPLDRTGDYLVERCRDGDASACHSRALDYELGTGGVEADFEMARLLYELACRNGSVYTDCRAWAEAELDSELRREAWTMTCEHGDSDGCLHLGWMLRDGDGGDADLEAAAARFAQICDDDHVEGCNDLAVALWDGSGIAADRARAVALWARACDADDHFGCFNLAGCFASGEGVAVDPARALELYRRACELGDDDGCAALEADAGPGDDAGP